MLLMLFYTGERLMVAKKTVLLVCQDDNLRVSLAEQLRTYEEFQIIESSGAVEAIQLSEKTNFDAIVLDSESQDINCFSAVRLIRSSGSEAIIIMMMGNDAIGNKDLYEEVGLSDYVIRPFRFNKFLEILRARIRQREQGEINLISIGPYIFQPARSLLTYDKGHKIRLTEKEVAIIKYLYKSKNLVVSRESLLEEVWGYKAAITTHTLETHVYRLRHKIEVDPYNATILVTEPGGYRLIV
jgi:DNA-binding response OmpR family regulator